MLDRCHNSGDFVVTHVIAAPQVRLWLSLRRWERQPHHVLHAKTVGHDPENHIRMEHTVCQLYPGGKGHSPFDLTVAIVCVSQAPLPLRDRALYPKLTTAVEV